MNNNQHFVCTLDELKDAVSLGWEKVVRDEPIQCLLVYHAGKVFSYINSCPHTGVNLEWQANQFLDNTGELIQCATHGALFLIKNGECIRGPCVGMSLSPVENRILDNSIYLILH